MDVDSDQMAEQLDVEELSDTITCPITLAIMLDPVRIQGGHDKHVFERSAIQKYFLNNSKNPVTGEEVENKTLVPAPDIKKLINVLGPYIQNSWTRVELWRDKLCSRYNLVHNAMTGIRMHQSEYHTNPEYMYKWYKHYMGSLVTIKSGGAPDYMLTWIPNDHYAGRLNVTTEAKGMSTVFTLKYDWNGKGSILVIPYGMLYRDAIFCKNPKFQHRVNCDVDGTENASCLSNTQWHYKTIEEYENDEKLIQLGTIDSDQNELLLDIYDSKKPSLKFWTLAKEISNQTWVVQPLYTPAELNDCC